MPSGIGADSSACQTENSFPSGSFACANQPMRLPQESFAWAVSTEGISMCTIVPFTPSPFVVVKVTEKLPNSSDRARGLGHVREHTVERARDLFEVERVDEQARVADLPAP